MLFHFHKPIIPRSASEPCLNRLSLNIVGTSNLSGNKFVMVKHGSAIVIENEAASRREADGVLSKPLFPAVEASSVLVWKRNIPYSAAAKQFIEFVRN